VRTHTRSDAEDGLTQDAGLRGRRTPAARPSETKVTMRALGSGPTSGPIGLA